jgi:Holliday junction resolvasome RuvABC DNA-binding subunit
VNAKERETIATFIELEKGSSSGLERQHVSLLRDLGYSRAEAAEAIGEIRDPRTGKDVSSAVLDGWWV